MARAILALLVLAVLAVGAILLLQGGERGTRLPTFEVASEAPVDGPSGPTGALDRPAELAPGEVEPSAETAATDAGKRSEARGPSANDLVVIVVDPADRPVAGVPLALETGTGRPRREVTAADGRAVFRGLRRDARARGEPLVLVHEIAAENAPRLALGADLLAQDEVRSPQPYTGSIEVRVLGAGGAPPQGETVVDLELIGTAEALDPTLAFDRPSWRGTAEQGRAFFPHVELGRDWEAVAQRVGFDVASRGRAQGPVSHGQTVRIDVDVEAAHPVLVLRAIDENGAPFGDATLTLERFSFFGSLGRHDVTTDATGVFTVDVESGWLAGGSLLVSSEVEGVGVLSGFVDIDGNREPGRHDLGDVVLSVDGVLVTGVVTDESGAAYPDAEVRVGRSPRFDTGFSFSFGPADLTTKSGPNGRFAMVGKFADPTFRLWAFDGNLRSQPVEAMPGDEVALELRPHWKLEGRLLLAEGPNTLPNLVLRDGETMSSPRSFDSDGSFAMELVPPGIYELIVSFGEVEVWRVGDIVLRDADVELEPIDLRRALSRHRVTLPGVEAVKGRLLWRSCGGEGDWTTVVFDGGEVELLAPTDCVDLQVNVSGYRTEEVLGVSGRADVRLQPAIRVRLVLSTTGELPKPPYVFDPDPRLGGEETGSFEGSRYFTDGNREVVFLAARPGRTEVRWHLERRADNMAIGGNVLSEHAVWIDVLDVPGEQVFELDLDGEALKQLTRKPPF